MNIHPITSACHVSPPPGRHLSWSLPPHIQYRVISPRNIQLIGGTSPRGCVGCHAEIQARHLIAYHGRRLCPACFAAETTRDRAEANARLARPTVASFSARARAYLERDIALGYQNCPEVCP